MTNTKNKFVLFTAFTFGNLFNLSLTTATTSTPTSNNNNYNSNHNMMNRAAQTTRKNAMHRMQAFVQHPHHRRSLSNIGYHPFNTFNDGIKSSSLSLPLPLPLPSTTTSTITKTSLHQFSRFTTTPDFLDENTASLTSYTIPPFQNGDDTLTSSKLRKNQRIVTFGDIHGDILALHKFMQASQLLHVNSTITNPIWDGDDAIIVQVGDILDRGPNELFCLRYLASLARQADKAGGKFYILHGNHETLNANGLFQYTDEEGDVEIESVFGQEMDKVKSGGSKRWRLQYAGNQPSRWNAFEPGGWLSEPLLKHMNVAVVIGRTCFVHAGLTKDHLEKFGGITKMNDDVRKWYGTKLPDDLQNDDGYKFQTVDEVIQNANARAKYISKNQPPSIGGGIGAPSPVWMRDYSSPGDGVPKQPQRAQAMISECLRELSKEVDDDVERMVMGHTPQNSINSALQDRAWRVDVGASKGVMNGTPEVLEIIHRGGKNDEDLLNILTLEGHRIPALERQTSETLDLF